MRHAARDGARYAAYHIHAATTMSRVTDYTCNAHIIAHHPRNARASRCPIDACSFVQWYTYSVKPEHTAASRACALL